MSKKILVTGGNGYIARNLIPFLFEYDLTVLTREKLDLLDSVEVLKFFKNNEFDIVIHTATCGGSRTQTDNTEWVYKNVTMFYNLMKCQSSFKKIINLGSGAQFDRRYSINGTRPLHHSFPIDPYGLSKNIISKIGSGYHKFQNLTIYNVFNQDEPDTRMIKNNIKRYINKLPLTILKDRKIDFFYFDDFALLIKYYIENNENFISDIDICYSKKYYLSEIANLINSLDDYSVDINIESPYQDLEYTGNCDKIESLSLPFVGLIDGINITYKKLLKDRNV